MSCSVHLNVGRGKNTTKKTSPTLLLLNLYWRHEIRTRFDFLYFKNTLLDAITFTTEDYMGYTGFPAGTGNGSP